MLWHVVRFTFPPDADPEARTALETELAGLAAHIDELAFLRLARDVEDPLVTGLLTGFVDHAGLEVYRDHPAHTPVVARARALCEDITRLDIITDDPTDSLPRTL